MRPLRRKKTAAPHLQESHYAKNLMQVSNASEILEKEQRAVAARSVEHPGNDAAADTHLEAMYEEQAPLCHRCSSIDVDSLFVDLGNVALGQRVMDLGKLTPETQFSSCPLCRLFYESKIEYYGSVENDNYFLYLVPWPRPRISLSRGCVLAVVSERIKYEPGKLWSELEHRFGQSQGFIATSTASKPAPHVRSLRARSIDSKSVDFDLIRSWIRVCRREHKNECLEVTSSTSGLKDLKLIDCEQRRIVAASPSNKYSRSVMYGARKVPAMITVLYMTVFP